ncbi:MAG TPA: ABC transporter permease [Candidatus Limnocylindrales bacterium]|jgi:simple sugar transport system permease protein
MTAARPLPRRRPTSRVRQVWDVLAVPVVAIVLALLVGAVVIVVFSLLVSRATFDIGLPLKAYGALVNGSLGSFDGLVETCVQATPLLLAGLGVAVGFRAGLFNIGAQGQFLLGALGSVWVGAALATASPLISIPLALVVGVVIGALWAGIAGYLKAASGAHEVVTTIMLNYVALAILSWIVVGPLRLTNSPQPVTAGVGDAALPIIIGSDGHLGLLIALVAVPLMWFLLYRTTIGFEIRSVGANADAARYAGMRPRFVIVLTMALAGGLAGLAGGVTLLGINHQMPAGYSTTVGFDAITVALLGRSNPWGVLPASLLFGAMRAGAGLMQIQAGVPAELVYIIQAIILLFLIIDVLLRKLPGLGAAKAGLITTDASQAAAEGVTAAAATIPPVAKGL